jgi:hypothetical protein
MRTTVSDDKAFIEHIIDNTILESAIDFIKDRFGVGEIYGSEALEEWALENGFVTVERESALLDNISDLEAENEELQNELNEYNE